jgi:hypothetical protein
MKMHERPVIQHGRADKTYERRKTMNFGTVSAKKYYFWAGVALVIIFTMLKPAGSEDTGFFSRFLFWTIQIGVLLPILIGVQMSLQTIIIFNQMNPWIKLIFSGVLGAVLFVPMGVGIDYLFDLDDWSGIDSLQVAIPIFIEEFLGLLLPVTTTWIAINAPGIFQLNFSDADSEAPSDMASAKKEECFEPPGEFFNRLPREIGDDVVYLKSELHYVRVVTSVGEKLVLYNLRDAIFELEKIHQGVQTHRSYWVCAKHIRDLHSRQGKHYILTNSGHHISVSRRNLPKVKKFIQEVL